MAICPQCKKEFEKSIVLRKYCCSECRKRFGNIVNRKKYKEKNGCSYSNNWQKNNRAKTNEYHKLHWAKYNKEMRKKRNCRNTTKKLLKDRGIIVSECLCDGECGNMAELVHHEDYNNPYDILYLCKKCHWGLHKEYNKIAKSL